MTRYWRRVVFLGVGLTPAVLVAIIGPAEQAIDADSTTVLRTMATVLSILTGFLIAVIATTRRGPDMYPGSWRVAYYHREAVLAVLTRYTMLYYVYLIAILATAIAILMSEYYRFPFAHKAALVAICIDLTAIAWSFGLPIALLGEHRRSLDDEVERRKAAAASDTATEPTRPKD